MGQNSVPESWVYVVFLSHPNMGEDSKETPYPHETSAEITRFNLPILVAKERIAGSTGLPLGNTDGVIVVQEDQTVTWWAVQSSTAIILIQGILLNW